MRQSPVDLTEEASILGKYPAIMFGNYSEVIKTANVRNTGHSSKYLLCYIILEFVRIRFDDFEVIAISLQTVLFDPRYKRIYACKNDTTAELLI